MQRKIKIIVVLLNYTDRIEVTSPLHLHLAGQVRYWKWDWYEDTGGGQLWKFVVLSHGRSNG
jgi:hypothetical protein